MRIPGSRSSYFFDKYITNVPLSLSCGLETEDQHVEYSLTQIFLLLIKFSGPWVAYFKKKLSVPRTLNSARTMFSVPWQLIYFDVLAETTTPAD